MTTTMATTKENSSWGYGKELYKDAYGQMLSIGCCVDDIEWWDGKLSIWRTIVLGTIESSGNLRVASIFKDSTDNISLGIHWIPRGKAVRSPLGTITTDRRGDVALVNTIYFNDEYTLDPWCSFVLPSLTDKQRKQFKL